MLCAAFHGILTAELSRLTPGDEFKELINGYTASFRDEDLDEVPAETGIERRRLAIENAKFARSSSFRPTPTEPLIYVCMTGSIAAKAAASSDEPE